MDITVYCYKHKANRLSFLPAKTEMTFNAPAFCSLYSHLFRHVTTLGPPIKSRRFSVETDIRVWKNTLRCFIKIISKTQTELSDLH